MILHIRQTIYDFLRATLNSTYNTAVPLMEDIDFTIQIMKMKNINYGPDYAKITLNQIFILVHLLIHPCYSLPLRSLWANIP